MTQPLSSPQRALPGSPAWKIGGGRSEAQLRQRQRVEQYLSPDFLAKCFEGFTPAGGAEAMGPGRELARQLLVMHDQREQARVRQSFRPEWERVYPLKVENLATAVAVMAEAVVDVSKVLGVRVPQLRIIDVEGIWGSHSDDGIHSAIHFPLRLLVQLAETIRASPIESLEVQKQLRVTVAHELFHAFVDQNFPEVHAASVRANILKGEAYRTDLGERAAEAFGEAYASQRKPYLGDPKAFLELLASEQRNFNAAMDEWDSAY